MSKAEIGRKLSLAFLPLVDGCQSRREQLCSLGFESLFTSLQFNESFCQDSDELAELRQVYVESKKEGLPWAVYRSPFLDNLREMNRNWLQSHPGVVDAMPEVLSRAGRRKAEMMLSNNTEFQRRRVTIAERIQQDIHREIRLHASSASPNANPITNGFPDNRKLWGSVVSETTGDHGFEEDSALSKLLSATNVFSKQIAKIWKIAMWADAKGLASAEDRTGQLEVVLRLVPAGPPTPELSSGFLVAVHWFLPLDRVFKFTGPTELEHFARGVLTAVCLVIPDIEKALRNLDDTTA